MARNDKAVIFTAEQRSVGQVMWNTFSGTRGCVRYLRDYSGPSITTNLTHDKGTTADVLQMELDWYHNTSYYRIYIWYTPGCLLPWIWYTSMCLLPWIWYTSQVFITLNMVKLKVVISIWYTVHRGINYLEYGKPQSVYYPEYMVCQGVYYRENGIPNVFITPNTVHFRVFYYPEYDRLTWYTSRCLPWTRYTLGCNYLEYGTPSGL